MNSFNPVLKFHKPALRRSQKLPDGKSEVVSYIRRTKSFIKGSQVSIGYLQSISSISVPQNTAKREKIKNFSEDLKEIRTSRSNFIGKKSNKIFHYPKLSKRSLVSNSLNQQFQGVFSVTQPSKISNSSIFNRLQKPASMKNLEFSKKKKVEKSPLQQHYKLTKQAFQIIKKLPEVSKQKIQKFSIVLPSCTKKKTLIFDLDQTLVHCVNIKGPHQHSVKVTLSNQEIVQVGINLRPYAIQCLKSAKKDFQIIVFTASHKCYADAVLNLIDPDGSLVDFRLYRENCYFYRGVYIKDLRILRNRMLKDIVIVDNSVYSFGYQIDNGVPIISWYDDWKCEELLRLLSYLKVLAQVQDIRTINRKTFKLKMMLKSFINKE